MAKRSRSLASLLLALAIAGAVASCTPRSAVGARVVKRTRDAVGIRIVNRSAAQILVISPVRPNRQVDEDRCTILLSTKIVAWIQPYAFTPELIAIEDGAARTFSVPLRVETLPSRCHEWRVNLEYAYIEANDAAGVRRLSPEDLRAYVLRHQQLASSE